MAMYPPSQEAYDQKHSPAPPQPAFQPGTATGVPVASPNQYRSENPQAHHHRPVQQGQWSTGLYDCCDDVGNCCITFWCPCITFGQIAEIVDEGTTSCGASGAIYGVIAFFTSCACLYSCFYRSKLRDQYMLEERPCNDCLTHCCCEACALCQEYRELKHRGFNMSIGWQGNIDKQNREVAMAAPMAPSMSK